MMSVQRHFTRSNRNQFRSAVRGEAVKISVWPNQWVDDPQRLGKVIGTLGQRQPHGDALSLDRLGSFGARPHADRFATDRQIYETHESARFELGSVDPVAPARFRFFFTDPTRVPAPLPAPGAAAVDGGGGEKALSPIGGWQALNARTRNRGPGTSGPRLR